MCMSCLVLCLHFILITLSHLSHLSGIKDRWNVTMKIIWYQDHIWKCLGFYLEKIWFLPLKSVHKKSDLVYLSLQRVTGALVFLEVTLHCVLSCRVLTYQKKFFYIGLIVQDGNGRLLTFMKYVRLSSYVFCFCILQMDWATGCKK